MGKSVPEPHKDETDEQYLKRLEDFDKNYWDYLVPNWLRKKK
jgi:hypothetical protein